MTDASQPYDSGILCPYCQKATIDTAATVTFMRGFLIAHQHGEKRFIGCSPCVAKQIRAEVGRSALYGWFSPTALIVNVFLIPWNLVKSYRVKPDRAAARAVLRELGVSDKEEAAQIDEALYAAMAAMIKADGKIDAGEVASAQALGPKLISNFSGDRLAEKLKAPATPLPQLASILNVAMKQSDKEIVLKALVFLAYADGRLDRSEAEMLDQMRLGLSLPKDPFDRMMADAAAANAAAAVA